MRPGVEWVDVFFVLSAGLFVGWFERSWTRAGYVILALIPVFRIIAALERIAAR